MGWWNIFGNNNQRQPTPNVPTASDLANTPLSSSANGVDSIQAQTEHGRVRVTSIAPSAVPGETKRVHAIELSQLPGNDGPVGSATVTLREDPATGAVTGSVLVKNSYIAPGGCDVKLDPKTARALLNGVKNNLSYPDVGDLGELTGVTLNVAENICKKPQR